MIVQLRNSNTNDMAIVLAWRNSPLIYQGLYQQSRTDHLITWEEHWDWFHSRHNWKSWIIEVNDGTSTRGVGQINFGQLDNWNPEVAILIGEVTLWGQGVGKRALSLALEWLKDEGYIKAHTTILRSNDRSIKMFESIGFKNVGPAREDEDTYELYLEERKRI